MNHHHNHIVNPNFYYEQQREIRRTRKGLTTFLRKRGTYRFLNNRLAEFADGWATTIVEKNTIVEFMAGPHQYHIKALCIGRSNTIWQWKYFNTIEEVRAYRVLKSWDGKARTISAGHLVPKNKSALPQSKSGFF